MDWITVSALILIGIFLLIIELVFIPGTTVVGILGFLMGAAGIWMGYKYFGDQTGHIILGITILLGAVVSFVSLRSNAWQHFALKNRSESRVNEHIPFTLEPGQKGITVSALRPSGTAVFNEQQIEVQTQGEFVASGTEISIIKIQNKKIIVEQVTS